MVSDCDHDIAMMAEGKVTMEIKSRIISIIEEEQPLFMLL